MAENSKNLWKRRVAWIALFSGLALLGSLAIFSVSFSDIYLPWYWNLENRPFLFYAYPLVILGCAAFAISGGVVLCRMDKGKPTT